MAERRADWLPIGEAVARVLGGVEVLETETVAITDAVGRVLRETISAPIDQPPWDNSAMDGFAVRAEDVRGASAAAPVTLDVIEEVEAGEFPGRTVGPGQAIRIMTGAPMPDGADCVIRVEHTQAGDGAVRIRTDDDAGRNVRRRGEDLRTGTTVLGPGAPLDAADVGVLVTCGRREVVVSRRPVVAILSNGDELAELDAYDEVLAGRKIANSNAYALAAAVERAGCVPRLLGIARDDVESIRAHLARGLDADALVTSAGASMGVHDLIKDVFEEHGLELDFWRVKMRPGSPFSFGRIPRDGRRPLPVFSLPGNPVSALVTFLALTRPALRRMLGRERVHTATIRVRAGERLPSKPGLTHFLRVTLDAADPPVARLTGPQGSGILTSMVAADALALVPEDADGIDAGAPCRAIPLRRADHAAAAPEGPLAYRGR